MTDDWGERALWIELEGDTFRTEVWKKGEQIET